MTAVLTLRAKTIFAGGILTGLGLSAYAFGLWIWWVIERLTHHMFIIGVSRPRAFLAIVLLPSAAIAIGVWMAFFGSKQQDLVNGDA